MKKNGLTTPKLKIRNETLKFMELHGFNNVNPPRRRTMNKSLL